MRLAKAHGVPLRQSYVLFKNNRYGHARQLRRQRRTTAKLKTVLGPVYRDLERRLAEQPESVQAAFAEPMALTKRLVCGEFLFCRMNPSISKSCHAGTD